MRVSALPFDPGVSGWDAILPEAHRYPTLEENRTADWLVIGAGFAGLSAARRLQQVHRDDTIAVLEAREIAQGPAGRNSGFMIDLPHVLSSQDYKGELDADRIQTEMNREAIRFAQDAAAEFEMPHPAVLNSGKINAAASERGLEKNRTYAGHLKTMQEPHEMLDADQMREICGSSYYRGGLYTPGTALLQPALYIRGLARGINALGVEILENSPVVELQRSAGNWIAKTPKGSFEAPRVILAVNGHAESFGYFKRSLMHIYLYASMTRPLQPEELKAAGGDKDWGFTPSEPMGSTVRKFTDPTGTRIVVRNRFTWNPSRRADEAALKSIAKTHRRAFQSRFPDLDCVELEHQWGGLLCLSRNEVPAFGEREDNLFFACCQNGLGTARGTFHGIMAAEQASNMASPHLEALLSHPDPQKLPPEPIASIGANVYMRWLEFTAGAEL